MTEVVPCYKALSWLGWGLAIPGAQKRGPRGTQSPGVRMYRKRQLRVFRLRGLLAIYFTQV